jgi:hypothetical protein
LRSPLTPSSRESLSFAKYAPRVDAAYFPSFDDLRRFTSLHDFYDFYDYHGTSFPASRYHDGGDLPLLAL